MDTLRRSRTPNSGCDSQWEVQTFEEAQIHVHDLGPFVTVQLFDETPAVPSLGKLCEDHGYSSECVSGQKPRLTKEGKTIVCKIDNHVPLAVPGLSANSGSSTSSSSSLRDPSSTDPSEEQREVRASGNGSEQSSRSQIMSRIQNHLHPLKFLMNQVRNELRKCQKNNEA